MKNSLLKFKELEINKSQLKKEIGEDNTSVSTQDFSEMLKALSDNCIYR